MVIKRQREIALIAAAILMLAVAVLAYKSRTAGPDSASAAQSAPSLSSASSASSSGPAAAPASHGAAASKSTTLSGPKVKSAGDVDLQALNAPRDELQETVRDPFRFKPKPPPPPPPAPVMRPTAPVQTGPVEPPPPPRIPLKFFGQVETKQGPLAALSDSRGVYYGRVGDTIEGRYRILRIGVESIDLAYLDGRGRQTIRQTGQ